MKIPGLKGGGMGELKIGLGRFPVLRGVFLSGGQQPIKSQSSPTRMSTYYSVSLQYFF